MNAHACCYTHSQAPHDTLEQGEFPVPKTKCCCQKSYLYVIRIQGTASHTGCSGVSGSLEAGMIATFFRIGWRSTRWRCMLNLSLISCPLLVSPVPASACGKNLFCVLILYIYTRIYMHGIYMYIYVYIYKCIVRTFLTALYRKLYQAVYMCMYVLVLHIYICIYIHIILLYVSISYL